MRKALAAHAPDSNIAELDITGVEACQSSHQSCVRSVSKKVHSVLFSCSAVICSVGAAGV